MFFNSVYILFRLISFDDAKIGYFRELAYELTTLSGKKQNIGD